MSILICIARFKAKPSKSRMLIESLERLVPLTKSEDGCLSYELFMEEFYDGSYGCTWNVCLIERWKSRIHFDDHCNTDYIKHFFNIISPQVVEKTDIRLYTPQ